MAQGAIEEEAQPEPPQAKASDDEDDGTVQGICAKCQKEGKLGQCERCDGRFHITCMTHDSVDGAYRCPECEAEEKKPKGAPEEHQRKDDDDEDTSDSNHEDRRETKSNPSDGGNKPLAGVSESEPSNVPTSSGEAGQEPSSSLSSAELKAPPTPTPTRLLVNR